MYNSRLSYLRDYMECSQKNIADYLNIKRATYQNWERGVAMIPIDMADKLSLYYKVSLSYILGIDDNFIIIDNIKMMNYDLLLTNLKLLKKENNHSFEDIANYLKCNRSTCSRYFNGSITIPIDRLIMLIKFYNVDLDKICGKI